MMELEDIGSLGCMVLVAFPTILCQIPFSNWRIGISNSKMSCNSEADLEVKEA